MLARPTVAALVCRQCQRLATFGRWPGAALGWRVAAAPRTSRRPFATDNPIARDARGVSWDETETEHPDENPIDHLREWAASSSTGSRPPPPEIPQVPWYLQVEPPLSAPARNPNRLPEMPENCEPIVVPLLGFIHDDMGLDDISLLDLRDLDTHSGLGPNLIMILGTGRSERHLQAAGLRLLRWLQREKNVRARTAGLISASEIKLKLRRLRKKQQLVGGSAGAFVANGKEHGLSTEWVVINLGTLGADAGESARMDRQGRLSGFGSRPTGTTIVVQCLTEAKRKELDLEGFWTSNLESQKRAAAKYEAVADNNNNNNNNNSMGDPTDEAAQSTATPTTSRRGQQFLDRGFLGATRKPYLSLPRGRQQQHQQQQQQTRRYSSTATPSQSSSASKPGSDISLSPRLAAIMPRLNAILLTPIRPQYDECVRLIGIILTDHDTAESERIELSEAMLRMMSERILPIAHQQVMAPLIVAVVRARVLAHMAANAARLDPDNAPPPPPESSMNFLARVQTNLETVMQELRIPCPNLPTLLDLIEAYGMQHNWPRCRATFDLPALWSQDRDRRLYVAFLRQVTASGSPELCHELVGHALRSILQERPAEQLNKELCAEFLGCIAVADPWAWNAVAHAWQDKGFDVNVVKVDGPSPGEGVKNWEKRECVNFLRELKDLWEYASDRS